jgi:hypothetical protein
VAFFDVLYDNQLSFGVTRKNWMEKLQEVLVKRPSAKVLKKETRALKFLRENETEVNKIFSDIQKLHDQLNKDDSSDKDSGEEFDREKAVEEMQSLIEEIKRLVKVIGDLAVDLGADDDATAIQTQLYDMEKGGPQHCGDGWWVLSQKNVHFWFWKYMSKENLDNFIAKSRQNVPL